MLKKIFTVLIESNVWVSSGLALLVFPAAHMLSVPQDWRIPILGFFVAMIVYTLDHRADVLNGEWQPSLLIERYYRGKISISVIIISILGVFTILSISPFIVTLSTFLLILVSSAYIFYFIPKRSGLWQRIKDIRGIKAWFTTALCTLSSVGAPIIFYGKYADLRINDLLMTLLLFYAMLICNAQSYDIGDLDNDTNHNVHTLPGRIGIRKTIKILYLINFGVCIILIIAWLSRWSVPHPEMLLWILGTTAYLSFIPKNNERFAYDFVVDGTLFLPTIAMLIGHIFHNSAT